MIVKYQGLKKKELKSDVWSEDGGKKYDDDVDDV